MYQIAICEDAEKDRQKTIAQLMVYGKRHPERKFALHEFATEKALLTETCNGDFDLLVLGISLPKGGGIHCAGRLREKGVTCPILFLTTSAEDAFDAFRMDAMQYLLRPVEADHFFAALDKIFAALEFQRRRHIALPVNGILRRMELREFLYSEAQGDSQLVHLKSGETLLLKMSCKALQAQIGFFADILRLGRGYLVNLYYIESVNAQELRLSGDIKISVPRGCYARLREAFFAYYRP